MNELINITTDGQGSSVVSARELYTFLGFDASQWSRWSKKNITGNPFAEAGRDYTSLDMMSSGSTDYALTLDFAKRLSMLARTEKGEQVRRYFVECERKATELLPPPAVAAPSTTEQLLVQLIAGQQELLQQLRADVESIKQNGAVASHSKRTTPALSRPTAPKPPHLSKPLTPLRATIVRKINDYCSHFGAEQTEAYNYLYKRMYEVYAINVYRLIRTGGESLIEALERYGHLDRLYSLIQAELSYSEE